MARTSVFSPVVISGMILSSKMHGVREEPGRIPGHLRKVPWYSLSYWVFSTPIHSFRMQFCGSIWERHHIRPYSICLSTFYPLLYYFGMDEVEGRKFELQWISKRTAQFHCSVQEYLFYSTFKVWTFSRRNPVCISQQISNLLKRSLISIKIRKQGRDTTISTRMKTAKT